MGEVQIKFEDYVKLEAQIQKIEDGLYQVLMEKRAQVTLLERHINSLESEIRFLRRQLLGQKEGQQ